MGLHDNPFARVFLLEQRRFPSVAGDDRLGAVEQPPRTHERTEQFSPFQSASVSVAQTLLQGLRQIQNSPVDRHDERNAAQSGGGQRDAAEPAQGVRVHHGHIRFARQTGDQVERH